MKKVFKKHLEMLERSRVGVHPAGRGALLLNRNERVVPYGGDVMNLLCKRLAASSLNLYPDLELFYRKLGRWLSVDESRIYVTEGISGAIKSLIETIARPGQTIVFPTPTFALYPVYCRMFDLKYKTVGYTADYNLDMKSLYGLIDKKTAIVFIPNPNVPIEGTLDLKKIAALAEYCAAKGAFLAIDEVYFPFGGPTAAGLIDRYDNLFVMRSFSKAFGLAGIRLGYVMGRRENIEYVSKTRTGYETNSVSAGIASFFIDNYSLVEKYIKDVREGLTYLKKELDRLGLKYNGGNASNFIYVDMADKALSEEVVGELKKRDIYVRGGWPEPYSGGICVTAGPRSLMETFAGELAGILKGRQSICARKR